MRVLVTGASRGIGRATALELAGEHDVAVNYRESETAAWEVAERVREAGAEATAVRADVSDPAEAERLVEETADALGGVDAVVNNAGVVAPDRLTEIDDDQWRRVIETNLSGAFYVTRAATSSSSPRSAAPTARSTPATPPARPVYTGSREPSPGSTAPTASR